MLYIYIYIYIYMYTLGRRPGPGMDDLSLLASKRSPVPGAPIIITKGTANNTNNASNNDDDHN